MHFGFGSTATIIMRIYIRVRLRGFTVLGETNTQS